MCGAVTDVVGDYVWLVLFRRAAAVVAGADVKQRVAEAGCEWIDTGLVLLRQSTEAGCKARRGVSCEA